MMSNPLTHVSTIKEYITGRRLNFPVTEIYAPIGARLNPRPRIK